jgi:hypothetical protein
MRRGGFTLSGGERIRPPIGEALADRAKQVLVGALEVVQLASVVAEIKLGGVAAKVLFADMVIGADALASYHDARW